MVRYGRSSGVLSRLPQLPTLLVTDQFAQCYRYFLGPKKAVYLVKRNPALI